MSTAEYRETAPPILRLGTGADMDPGAHLLLTFDAAALPHVDLAHDDLLGEPFFVKRVLGRHPYTNIFDAIGTDRPIATKGTGTSVGPGAQAQYRRCRFTIFSNSQASKYSRWKPLRSDMTIS